MSASQYRSQLASKRKQLLNAEKEVRKYQTKESTKRAEADKARQAAQKTKSDVTARSKLREAQQRETEAAAAGKEAGRWRARVTGYAKEEQTLATRLSQAERSEADAADRKQKRAQQQAERTATAQQAALDGRMKATESAVDHVMRQLREPKREKLRVLILGASSEGDLRVGREQKRIRNAVEFALHRDQIELDVRPAATTTDLLDGITKFRPHVVHFSGHSNDDLIVFEDELDQHHDGVVVTARAFRKAVEGTDFPPLLVMLNSCNSAAQIDDLVAEVTDFAIGMSDSIEDSDAINYAAQFYAAIANGQSIRSAHISGQASIELTGVGDAELPTLAHAPDVDPATTILVKPD